MLMKRISILLLILVLAMCFTACQDSKSPQDQQPATDVKDPVQETAATYELALITDSTDISNSDPFIQNAWAGLKKYAEENEITYTCYVPAEVSDQGYVDAIGKAVNNGAQLIVLPGSLFEVAAYDSQYRYPNTSFVLLDGQPRTADYKTYAIENNVNSIYFAEEEIGFLAGYSVVKEGYTKLGFIGGMALPNIVRYGYGFITGAKYAAAEDSLSGIEIKYTYSGEFSDPAEIQTIAGSWYNAGTEVIIGCGGNMLSGITAAAEPVGAYVVAVDTDRSEASPTVITSCVKEAAAAVFNSIENYYNGEFHGGIIDRLTVSAKGVSINMESSRFNNFTADEYDIICNKMTAGEITIATDETVDSPTKLANEAVKVLLDK